jgi:hypothetical protein
MRARQTSQEKLKSLSSDDRKKQKLSGFPVRRHQEIVIGHCGRDTPTGKPVSGSKKRIPDHIKDDAPYGFRVFLVFVDCVPGPVRIIERGLASDRVVIDTVVSNYPARSIGFREGDWH